MTDYIGRRMIVQEGEHEGRAGTITVYRNPDTENPLDLLQPHFEITFDDGTKEWFMAYQLDPVREFE